jgi:uncharacterized RDD family membrane protein YckC
VRLELYNNKRPMLDTIQNFETPEGVDLDLHIAGPVVRACAWAIDALIRVIVYWIASIALMVLGNVGTALMALGFFLMEWIYPVVFEVVRGATPGKKLMNLSVVQDDGTPVSVTSSMLRNLLWIADFFPLFYFTGLVSMTLNTRFKRLGDLVAGTLVVYLREEQSEISIPDRESRVLPTALLAVEKSAILNFAERSELYSLERQIELTDIIGEYAGASGSPGLDRVLGYANWLVKGSDR